MPKLTSPVTLILFVIPILLLVLSFLKKKALHQNKLSTILGILLFVIFFFSPQLISKADAYTCYNGPSSSDSGGCGAACEAGNPWSQYDKIPRPSTGTDPEGYICFPSGFCLKYLTYVCSTADKCVNPSDNGLKAGYCDCSTGGLYKVCCNGVNRVACIQLNQDNQPDPEGVCSGTTVYGTSCPSSGGGGGSTTICGNIGGTYCNHSDSSCPSGTTPLGTTSDCVMCCGPGGSTETHTACSGTSCVTVSGAGSNACSSDADCGGGGGGGGGGCIPGVWDSTRCAECGQADCTDYGTPATAYCVNKCAPGTGGVACVISSYNGACPSGYVLRGGCCQCP